MNVARIRIENILGIEALDIEPAALTLVTGANGAGKTSVIEAIKTVFQGGHDATLIRQGAESGEVVLVLDDGVEIRKRIGERRSSLTATHPVMGAMGAGKSYLDRITDALAFNPIEFLHAPKKRRLDWLLEAMPLEIPAGAFTEVTEGIDPGLVTVDTSAHALDIIAEARKQVYDERTAVNRTAKDKRASADELYEAIPDTEIDPDKLAAERLRLEAAISETIDVRAKAFGDANREREATITKAKAAYDKAVEEATRRRDARHEKVVADTESAIEQAKAMRATLDEQIRAAERNAQTAAMQSRLAQEATEAEQASAALTRAIDRLDALKQTLMEETPVDGLEVADGEITYQGVPFDRLNHAKKIELAMEIAKLRAGTLGLVCVDGLEALDPEAFEAFCAWAETNDHGLQLVVTAVGEGPLHVETSGVSPAQPGDDGLPFEDDLPL